MAAVIEQARKDGLPTEPLVLLALEGASKRAPGALIVGAVRRWAADLKRARDVLGPAFSEKDVVAGASALRAGVKPAELERLREAKSGVRLASSLDVLSFLVSKGVPADTIAPVIVRLVLASATDDQLASLQQDIERDISGGIEASVAASLRGQGLQRQLATAEGNGGGPGGTLPSVRGQQRAIDPLANPQAVGQVQGNANVSGAGDGARPAAPRGKPKPKRP